MEVVFDRRIIEEIQILGSVFAIHLLDTGHNMIKMLAMFVRSCNPRVSRQQAVKISFLSWRMLAALKIFHNGHILL